MSTFGYCYVQVGPEILISPVFEHFRGWDKIGVPDQVGFRQAVQAEIVVPEDAQVGCTYARDRETTEQQRRERPDGKDALAAGVKRRTIDWAPPPPPPKPTGPPVAEEVPAELQAMIAADPYFIVPKGNGSTVDRIDEQRFGSGNETGTLVQTVRAQQDGNVCVVSQQVAMHQGQLDLTMDGRARSWAGLVPLTAASRVSNSLDTEYAWKRVVSLRHEGDALFPLRQGAHTVLTLDAQVRDDNGEEKSEDLRLDCTVGETTRASTVIAKATGTATELRCSNTLPSAPAAPAQEVVYHWFADAGCFVNAPLRP